jgi:hypothetical protein
MKETKIQIARSSIEIPVSDIYDYTIKQMVLNTFSQFQIDAIHQVLNDIEWLKIAIDSYNMAERLKLYSVMLHDMKDGLNPHPLLWSSALYYFTQSNINTASMRQIVNTSKALKNELKESELWKLLWN